MTNQEAIEWFRTKYAKAICNDSKTPVGMAISALQAQTEIIHCKECEYGVQDEYERWYCRGFGCQVGEEDGSGFCADAERKK